MDAERFDRLTKALSPSGTRRRLVRLLAALPLGAALAAVLGDGPEATAKKKKKQQTDDDHGSSHRRHRRKARHRHRPGQHKDNPTRKRKRKGCKPKSDAKTCAGTCGTVRNTCGKQVNCGPCTCATGCPQCQICNPATRRCDPIANGTACDDGNACTQTDTCQNGVCVGANPLADGQCCGTPNAGTRCEGGACVPATATLAECQGRCNGGSVPICGQAANCPSCIRCGCELGFCPDGAGPLGHGSYCATLPAFAAPGGDCNSDPCPGPNMFCCAGGTCETICTTERDV